MSDTIFKYTLDEFRETQSIGSIGKAIGNNLYGYNHRQTPGAIPITSKDTYGFTFFTRPQLNLRSVNIRNVRKFYDLLTTYDDNMQRFVRCTLDPRLEFGTNTSKDNQEECKSIFVDNKQAFIPLLTNALVSLSGWPDLDLPTFTSKEGVYKEQYTQVDGINELYNTFDITATFNNTIGDPIMYLFYIWTKYMSYVFEGKLSPYPDFITGNLLDYCTRIYRVVLDQKKRYVTKMVSCGIAFPTSVPLSQAFDYKTDKAYIDQTREVSIRFKCIGCEYYDPIVPLEFNRVVEIFNNKMACGFDGSGDPSEHGMTRIPYNILQAFNFKGYPRINLNTNEFEWWVDNEVFSHVESKMLTKIGEEYFIDYTKFFGSKPDAQNKKEKDLYSLYKNKHKYEEETYNQLLLSINNRKETT